MKLQECFGCEENKTYHVYSGKTARQASSYLPTKPAAHLPGSALVIHEDGGGCGGFCFRQCFAGCRSIKMEAMTGSKDRNYRQTYPQNRKVFNLERPCMPCPCCMCQQIDVTTANGSEIGKIRSNCIECCNMCCGNMTITQRGKHVADVSPPNCFCCFMTCCSCLEDCKSMPFEITTPNGRSIGQMVKEKINADQAMDPCYLCLACCCGGANYMESFHLQINPGARLTPNQRTLLLCLAVMIDITYFEDHTDNNKNKSGGGF